jgi:putative spermidine/putrescine transport system permease protein
MSGVPVRTSGALRRTTTVLLLVWFVLPVLPLLLWTFAERWSFPAAFPTEWGVGSFRAALELGAVPALGRSLVLSLCVAAISTLLGTLAARALTFGAVPGARMVSVLLLTPIALPPFAAVLGVNVVLLRGQIPPFWGTVLVLTVVALPYTAFVMRTAFGAYDLAYEEEARLLGARRAQLWRRVQLPMLAPALARAGFLAFLVAWSDYLVTLIVGGGEIVTLPLVVASAASGLGNDAAVAVLSLSAVVPPVLLLAAIAGLGRRRGAAPGPAGRARPTPQGEAA